MTKATGNPLKVFYANYEIPKEKRITKFDYLPRNPI